MWQKCYEALFNYGLIMTNFKIYAVIRLHALWDNSVFILYASFSLTLVLFLWFSDIKVSLKCEGVKTLAITATEKDGSFKANLPSYHTKTSTNCFAKLLGGPTQLYTRKQNQVSQITKGKEENTYTISTPLSFMISCPKNTNCKAAKPVGSSKTVDLPLPPAWGLAPSSYYVPFVPIIGIP